MIKTSPGFHQVIDPTIILIRHYYDMEDTFYVTIADPFYGLKSTFSSEIIYA